MMCCKVLRHQLPCWFPEEYLPRLNVGGEFGKVESLLYVLPFMQSVREVTGGEWEMGDRCREQSSRSLMGAESEPTQGRRAGFM